MTEIKELNELLKRSKEVKEKLNAYIEYYAELRAKMFNYWKDEREKEEIKGR